MIDSRARALVYDVDLFQFGSCPMQLRLIVGWLFSLKKIFDPCTANKYKVTKLLWQCCLDTITKLRSLIV